MKTVILLVLIAVGILLALRARMDCVRSETAIGAVATEHDALLRNLARAQQRLQAAQQARAALARAPAAEIEPLPRKLSADAALANNPALMAESLRYRHDVPDWWWGRMFRTLGFSPQQIEQWKQMIVQREQRRLDLIAAVETQGLDRNSEAFKALNAEIEKLWRDREAEILGDLAPKYREFQHRATTRNVLESLMKTGVYSGEPITVDQMERATQVLAANTRQILRATIEGSDESTPAINWAAAHDQLKAILSPSQIAALQAVGQQWEKVLTLGQQVDDRSKELTARFSARPTP